MTAGISFSLAVCLSTILIALAVLRSDRLSLGLPFAYLFTLQLNHVPGAYAHLVRPELFATTQYVALGLWHTAVGSSCFVVGLLVARGRQSAGAEGLSGRAVRSTASGSMDLDVRFRVFCLLGGWFFVYGLSPFSSIPSLGALIEKGGAIWILGVMLGLREALTRPDASTGMVWLAALSVYPTLMLILGGFLSYGSAAAIIAMSITAVTLRSMFRVLLGCIILVFIGLTVFVNYFVERDDLREVVWSSNGLETRINAAIEIFSNMEPLNLTNDGQANAFNDRLNQNYFVGLAAERVDNGLVEFRYGQSFYEAAIAVIPRAIWPDKPVFGGSGTIVREMTGLPLSLHTSWGVGQVMEFYINFGWWSLTLGFIFLGWLIGRLDRKAALAVRCGNSHRLLVCFLPAVALIQPIGSFVELCGGAAAAYFAALVWSRVWTIFSKRGRALGRAPVRARKTIRVDESVR